MNYAHIEIYKAIEIRMSELLALYENETRVGKSIIFYGAEVES